MDYYTTTLPIENLLYELGEIKQWTKIFVDFETFSESIIVKKDTSFFSLLNFNNQHQTNKQKWKESYIYLNISTFFLGQKRTIYHIVDLVRSNKRSENFYVLGVFLVELLNK